MADKIGVKVIKVYFEGRIEPENMLSLYRDNPQLEFGGWREDENGAHLRLLAIGDVKPEELTPDRFSKYGKVKDVAAAASW